MPNIITKSSSLAQHPFIIKKKGLPRIFKPRSGDSNLTIFWLNRDLSYTELAALLICQCLYLIIVKMQGRSRSSSQSSYRDQRDNKSYIEPSTRLFIAGISPQANPDDIRSMFETIGPVNDFFIKRPQENNFTFGFVQMGTLEQARQAINAFNGRMVCEKMIIVKYAKPKEDRTEKRQSNNFEGRNNFNRPPREERDRPQNRHHPEREREDKPRWNRGVGQKQFDHQGYRRQNNQETCEKDYGGRDNRGYQRQEGRQGRDFGNRGNGGFNRFEGPSKASESQSEAPQTPIKVPQTSSEEFDY